MRYNIFFSTIRRGRGKDFLISDDDLLGGDERNRPRRNSPTQIIFSILAPFSLADATPAKCLPRQKAQSVLVATLTVRLRIPLRRRSARVRITKPPDCRYRPRWDIRRCRRHDTNASNNSNLFDTSYLRPWISGLFPFPYPSSQV